MKNLFDLSGEYEHMLNKGLRLSGENKQFFLESRVDDVAARLPVGFAPSRILDFGCGTGETSCYLSRVFPSSSVLGADLSEAALGHAREQARERPQITFENLTTYQPRADFDLCYVNGVFHHVKPRERHEVLRIIADSLRPGGCLAVFENNPYNLGARLVMRRIPFDHDAIMLSHREVVRRVREAGLRVIDVRFLFYFPKPLAWLRPLEKHLAHARLGAQYYVLCEKI